MKLIEITHFYPAYLQSLYDGSPNLESLPYAAQKESVYSDYFGWLISWRAALKKSGYDVDGIIINNRFMLSQWARENNLNSDALTDRQIAVRQLKALQPEILMYNSYDAELLKEIKKEVTSLKTVFSQVGSALQQTNIWKELDFIISCAPESVNYLKKNGFEKVYHVNHAFDPLVNQKIAETKKSRDLIFIGQLTRQSQFHINRDLLLEKLTAAIELEIFTPLLDSVSAYNKIESVVKKIFYRVFSGFKKAGIPEKYLSKIPLVGKAATWPSEPLYPVNLKLAKRFQKAVFGLKMYQAIKNSKISLNIHADSSPEYASNLRLFETTGVGTCLLTDWRKNIKELFEPDSEIVTYASVEECVEKAKWLLANPGELDKIAAAGQRRCFKDHNFDKRAEILVDLLQRSK